MKISMKCSRLFIYLLLIFSLVPVLPGQAQKQEKDLSYEVSVSAQLVPIYAVDKKGNPVFDLKKEEIKLYADGKPMEVIYFNGYRVEEQQRVKVSAQVPQRKPVPPRHQISERIIIIILDSLISNQNVYDISQTIARGIIKNAPPGDAFILMESNQVRGLQYIAGPLKDKAALMKALEAIKRLYLSRRMHLDPGTLHEVEVTKGSGGKFGNPANAMALHVLQMDRDIVENNKSKYRRDIQNLTQSIQELQYALKTITLPKTVFLITTNPQKQHLGGLTMTTWNKESVPVTYYRFLEKAARAINMGGSMFYLINPMAFRSKQKRTELKFMSDAGHGKLIHGTSLKEIVEKVKKSTSAYYEMAFYPHKKTGEKSSIKLKCTRKGVELITIGYSEQGKPYQRMNTEEKKLFALNIVNRGSWSRMVAKVGRIKYNKLPKPNPGTSTETIEVDIPPVMQNRPLELVTVYIDPETQEAAVERKIKTMGEKETLQITPMPGRDSYFIIIEPQTPLCIYNQVI